jgi:hypothetical protein
LLKKETARVSDLMVLHLFKLILKTGGICNVPGKSQVADGNGGEGIIYKHLVLYNDTWYGMVESTNTPSPSMTWPRVVCRGACFMLK